MKKLGEYQIWANILKSASFQKSRNFFAIKQVKKKKFIR